MRGLSVAFAFLLGTLPVCLFVVSSAWGQYEVEEGNPVWVRGLLDVRLARGGRFSSCTSRGPRKTRYGGRETKRATRFTVSQLALELGAALPWDVVARGQLNWDPDGYNDDRPLLIEAYLRKEWGAWEQGWGRTAHRLAPSPARLPIPVGTEVSFPNQDQIHHHVHSFSRTKRFQIPLYRGEEVPPIVFDKVGVVKVACKVH